MTFLMMLAQWIIYGNTAHPCNEVTRQCWRQTFRRFEGKNFIVFDGFYPY